jgi:hypothetical protein
MECRARLFILNHIVPREKMLSEIQNINAVDSAQHYLASRAESTSAVKALTK